MDIIRLKAELMKQVEDARSLAELEGLRIAALGKKGTVTGHLKRLAELSPEDRKELGQELNGLKQELTLRFVSKQEELEAEALSLRLLSEKLDLTLPIESDKSGGRLHPLTRGYSEIAEVFASMGFEYAEGPDIEDDWHNFTALNIPEWHPARDSRDSFFIKDCEYLLRTETSAVQIRKMEKDGVPVKVFCPGPTYRVDLDATHSPMFNQVEGLIVGEDVTMAHLLGYLKTFLALFFEVPDSPIRVRQHHFPFTEPSIEIDVLHEKREGRLLIGQGKDYMELLGAGMVHPKVLENCNVDSKKYQGAAFGIGIDRLVMLKYGIPDLRDFYAGDIRWLKHYGFQPHQIASSAEGLS